MIRKRSLKWFSMVTNFNEEDNTYALKKELLKVQK